MSRPSPNPIVLLVEDSEDDAFFFLRALRNSGGFAPQVTHVDDGGRAIQHLQRAAAGEIPVPDFIYLDLKIPSFTGFEVLEWIRTQSFDPPLEIAVLSGSEQSADKERAFALGATAYYVKPILAAQLNLRFSTWREKLMTGVQPEIVQVASGPNGPA